DAIAATPTVQPGATQTTVVASNLGAPTTATEQQTGSAPPLSPAAIAAAAAVLSQINPAAGPGSAGTVNSDPEDRQTSDDLASSVAAPLANSPVPPIDGKKPANAVTIIPGMVSQALTPATLSRPHGAAGLDEDAPAWGNDAALHK